MFITEQTVRIIFHSNLHTYTEPLFKDVFFEIFPIKAYKQLHDSTAHVSTSQWPANRTSLQQTMSYYDTWSKTFLHQPVFKSEFGRKGIRKRGMLIWNKIIS